jgi:3-hydroxyisobutyrate dehydrogenase-like beta-hydroxyacid dehydrogenase
LAIRSCAVEVRSRNAVAACRSKTLWMLDAAVEVIKESFGMNVITVLVGGSEKVLSPCQRYDKFKLQFELLIFIGLLVV